MERIRHDLSNLKYKFEKYKSKNRPLSHDALEKVFSIDSNPEQEQVLQELHFLGDFAGVFGVFATNWLHSSR